MSGIRRPAPITQLISEPRPTVGSTAGWRKVDGCRYAAQVQSLSDNQSRGPPGFMGAVHALQKSQPLTKVDDPVPDDHTPARHPGSGRRAARSVPKGRQVEPAAIEEKKSLLGEMPRQRDLLIEYLHLIQDRYGHLSVRHLAALAEELHMAQTEIYEVATFYAHFDVVHDDEAAPPSVTVRVCDSLSCAMAGAETLLGALSDKLGP